jgi:cell wall-associated NlpC family hydrolase
MPGGKQTIRGELPLMIGAACVALIAAGCSSSSPRFKSADSGTGTVVQEDDEFRFASKVREEETREDDKKVDQNQVKKRLTPQRQSSGRYSNLTPSGLNRDRVLLDVVSFLGVPYAYGGNSRQGMDCSGFTAAVYASAAQKNIPRLTRDQYRVGAEVEKTGLQFGDLVFFNTTGRTPSHVGIYLEDDLFVHASVSYGVTISSLESTYYNKRYVGARRVVD